MSLFSIHSFSQYSGNPIFPGWYADPEARIFKHQYWVYPTYSAKYDEQVFLDAFSSPDLVHWTKHSRIVDTASVKWARRAMWAPSIVEKEGKWSFEPAQGELEVRAHPGIPHRIPTETERTRIVNQEDAGRAMALGLLDFIGPAPVGAQA